MKSSCILKDPNNNLSVELKLKAIKSEKKHYNMKVSVENKGASKLANHEL